MATTGFEGPDDEIEFEVGEEGGEEREFEIEVKDEEGDVADEDAPAADLAEPEKPQAPEPEARPKFRADARVQAALQRAAEAEAERDRERAEKDTLRQQLAERERGEYRAVETGLVGELSAAKRKLADAHAIGDYEAVAEQTAEVGRLSADLQAVKSYTTQRGAEQPKQAEQPQRQEPQQARVEPRTQAWISESPWFVPGTPEYDPELAVEAQAFAKKLEIRSQREGKQGYIGSDEYFNQINAHMAKTYPDVFEYEAPPAAKKVPTMRADKNVAPVQRQDAAMQPKQKGNIVRLSAEQRDMAERMFPAIDAKQAWATYARHMKG
jgi:hypothetical protein